MIVNYISLLTLIILWSTILTSAEAQDTYDKCKNAMTEFRGACRNLSGFTTTMKMRDKAASVHILKNLTKLIQPLEPGPINLSIYSYWRILSKNTKNADARPDLPLRNRTRKNLRCANDGSASARSSRTANIECNEPLPYQIEFIIVIVMERYGALDLYICLDNVVTLIKRDIDTDFTANCICAHVWSCKYSVAPDGLCRLFNNCSCQNTRDVLHTAVINRPPQMLASFTQSRCPPADCCMTDQAAEWTSWTVCTEPTIDLVEIYPKS
uniref:Uncharacterized protein n=1 Tax=Romanomermis culicivorax TaxID=13658 RepID=A0A915K817_ROMCU